MLSQQPVSRSLAGIEERTERKIFVIGQFFAAPDLPDALRTELFEKRPVHWWLLVPPRGELEVAQVLFAYFHHDDVPCRKVPLTDEGV